MGHEFVAVLEAAQDGSEDAFSALWRDANPALLCYLRVIAPAVAEDVAEAAVIGVVDEKWGERPLAAVVRRPGASVSAAELREFLRARVPRWQLPERWSFIAEVPKTSVGKFAKTRMRESYARGDYEVVEVR